jgi:hypothetical protein
MKKIVIENKKNLVVGVGENFNKKHKNNLLVVDVEYNVYNDVLEGLESGRIYKYVDGQLQRSPYWCDFVIVEAWLTIMNSNFDAVKPPFATANEYWRSTYETRVLKNYGFDFSRVYKLNGRQYDGWPHGNSTLMLTTIK